ncbi:Beta-mannosyltransferase 6 [Spathaspora sp. JA1]|nr:Beta-mannosyltransferase 6 [Spathaspora sp. JA1]
MSRYASSFRLGNRGTWKGFLLLVIILQICIIPLQFPEHSANIKSLVKDFISQPLATAQKPTSLSNGINPQPSSEVEAPSTNCQVVDEIKGNEEPSELPKSSLFGDFHEHGISLYSSMHESENCNDINSKHQLNISDYKLFQEDYTKMAIVLLDQLHNDEAFKDLAPFFEGKIPSMLRKNIVSKHFYKFAATSVWLKEYGLHLMVSRVLFSRKGIKWNPQLSLLYAETFNENWEPVNDIQLNVSGNDTLTFPTFLPVPFYHNVHNLKGRWYGPEDARILLFKNEQGKEEPLVIFNAHHRKFSKKYLEQMKDKQGDKDKLDLPQLHPRAKGKDNDENFTHYRSMFIAWPFQFETGKRATDDLPEAKYRNIRFNKARELVIEGRDRNKVEKNWTPFIDPAERSPYDSHINIVYDWENLQVLQCQLTNITSDSFSNCKVIFNTPGKQKVGPIRGGTELIPISTVIPGTSDTMIPTWIGFLRTHIRRCGCGREMYRPHLVVFHRNGNNFRVSHISSSIGFDVPLISARNKDRLCTKGDPNILMPNGISTWEYDKETDTDYLSLSLSRGDQENLILNIKNLGKLVEEDLDCDNEWSDKDSEWSLKMNSCVLKSSVEFCSAYGKEIQDAFTLKKSPRSVLP